MTYVAFDLEIARIIPDGAQDWKEFRPFGITCAAALSEDGDLRMWYGIDEEGNHMPQMSAEEVGEVVDYLLECVAAGNQILTWNGLGFDFDVLAEESGRVSDCRSMAWDHVDMMFHFFCLKGFALGLDTAAQGMRLSGKTPGMHGALAPIYWKEGKFDSVLDYLAQDVHTTLQLGKAVEAKGSLRWESKNGRMQFVDLKHGWLTAQEANELPLPDIGWMRNPWKREKFTGWLG